MLNNFVKLAPFRGLAKNKWAVLLFCLFKPVPTLPSFSSAVANASGSRVVSAPLASAKYSR